MGGSAFSVLDVAASAVPRIPPAVYQAVKARLGARLETLYAFISTPHEAPEKNDHGDLDFLACIPLDESLSVSDLRERTLALLGAALCVPGDPTSNFAVPIGKGEWSEFGAEDKESEARLAAEADKQSQLYYQVDVHVCRDKAEFARVNFFHGYGDLGMILGLVAKNKGLKLGVKGLAVPHIPRPPFPLTDSMDEIMTYMGLSMDRWKQGFATKEEIFRWVGTSTFFDPKRFRTQGTGIKKVKPERKMYAAFVVWANDVTQHAQTPLPSMTADEQIIHALNHFGKKEEFDAINREDAAKARIRESFSGSKVRAWTGLPTHRWFDLKRIMDQVRQSLGGELGVSSLIEEKGEDGVKAEVLRAQEQLGITVESSAADVETTELARGLEAVKIN